MSPTGRPSSSPPNGGSSWTVQPIPATVGYLSDISCSDRRHCTAVGQTDPDLQRSGGHHHHRQRRDHWTAADPPGGHPRRDRRRLSGQPEVPGHRDDGGRHRPPSSPHPPSPAGSSRSDPATRPDRRHQHLVPRQPALLGDDHVAVDVDHVAGQVALTTDGGATWATTAAPSGSGLPQRHRLRPRAREAPGARHRRAHTTSSVDHPGHSGHPRPSDHDRRPATAPRPPRPPEARPVLRGAWCVAVGTTASTVTGTRTGHGVVLTTTNGGDDLVTQPVSPWRRHPDGRVLYRRQHLRGGGQRRGPRAPRPAW